MSGAGSILLTDREISELVAEPKLVPPDWVTRLVPKQARIGHLRRRLEARGSAGSDFRIEVRQNERDPFDFSAILMYLPPRSAVPFRLRRYNGRSHQHANKIEGDRFFDYHIHLATERYQVRGFDPDAYAEPTDRYTLLDQAVRAMATDCAFYTATAGSDGQVTLFGTMMRP